MKETTNSESILLEYRKTVRNLFDTGASDVIDNSSPRHASILIEEMVRHAQVSFYAFAGRMNPEVWNANVMAALNDAVQRGVLVRLLVEEKCFPFDEGTMPESVRSTVRRFDPNHAASDFAHCAVGDGRSFRLEMDDAEKTAMFSANNTTLAGRVLNIASFLYDHGVPYAGSSAA